MKVSELVDVVSPRTIIEFMKVHTNLLVKYDDCKNEEVAMMDNDNTHEITIYFKERIKTIF